MKKSYHWRAILLTGLLFVLFSCDKDEITNSDTGKMIPMSEESERGPEISVVYGPDIQVGPGIVHSWISFNRFDIPLEIGVEMTPEVLNDLPADADFEKDIVIPLPGIAKERTAFDHIKIAWSPKNYSTIDGLAPSHFNFYFFMISEAERMQIPAWSEETEIYFANYPPKNFMPLDFVPVIKSGGSYEFIGRYWLPLVPEKGPLTHTMVLGTYDGAYIFISPVSTFEFLKLNNKATRSLSQPLLYHANKLFPREYNIYTNERGNYCVTLGNFIRR
nr:hypothetical protein [uncultured Flavobacterium sp.]